MIFIRMISRLNKYFVLGAKQVKTYNFFQYVLSFKVHKTELEVPNIRNNAARTRVNNSVSVDSYSKLMLFVITIPTLKRYLYLVKHINRVIVNALDLSYT